MTPDIKVSDYPPRLAPTGPKFHGACMVEHSTGGWTYVHDWRVQEIYQTFEDEQSGHETVIWYCTRCREVRHDPNGAPSY